MIVHHVTATVDGREVFYREAGPADAPTVVLLHGFPTSSFMFRNLIPRLAERYHVIAPDHLGFGFSAAPTADELDYTFDALTAVTQGLLSQLGVESFFIYVQDYGAPIGWRLALQRPESILGVVSQNGNAYEDGFVASFWDPVWAYAANPSPATETPLRAAFQLETIRWQYVTGVEDPTVISPDTWHHDYALVNRPNNPEIQLALFRDYATNRALYPQTQAWFRSSQVPLLAVWGGHDEIFGPDGARAFSRDLPAAQVELLPSGHFALETHLDAISLRMLAFLDVTTAATSQA
jgi:pimeloyl-ACP methyl ester carboxylesterase